MPNILNEDGLTTSALPELVDDLTAGFQRIYGPDINIASDTPDGQMINLQSQAIVDTEDLATNVYTSMNPDNAVGKVLDQRVSYNGIQRKGGSYSILNLDLTTTQSVNLYGLDQEGGTNGQPVYTVADNSGNQWFLIATALGVGIGTTSFAFRAATPGVNNPAPNTINIPVSIVLGVSGINNPTAPSVIGIAEESDPKLRLRRQISVALSGQGWQQSLRAALLNINGITDAEVYENTGASPDADGIPGHGIWAVISGAPSLTAPVWSAATTYIYGQLVSVGSTVYISWKRNNIGNNPASSPSFWGVYNAVAQNIYFKRNAGPPMKGAMNYTVTKQDGSSIVISYDIVTPIPLFIQMTVFTMDSLNAPDIAGIRAGLVTNYVPAVYGEVDVNGLGTAIQAVDPNTLAINTGFSLTYNGSYGALLKPVAKNLQFAVSSPNIIILPMILNAPGATPTIVFFTVTQMNVSILAGGATLQFTGLGGYGALTYSLQSGPGSINGTGLYTSAGAGTAVAKVLDSLGNQALAQITVT